MATDGLRIRLQRMKTYKKRLLNVTSPDSCRTVLIRLYLFKIFSKSDMKVKLT